MKIKEDILFELKAISTVVANVPYLNVYTIDDEYFAGIDAELKARIAADALTGSVNKFTVPQGYFENLSASILHKIKQDENEIFAETNEQSTLVASIGNKNIFTAPKYYFEELAFAGQEKPVAKVIKMSRARFVFKYAAAAVITGLLGLTIINIVDRKDIKVADEISVQTAINDAQKIIKTGSFDKELESISDKDIEQYLQQGGVYVNAALVAASTDDETSLPEASEYLLDENALDNYLKQKNLN